MKWRVMVEVGGVEETVQLHEVSTGGCTTAEYSAETLGLSVAEGKMTLAGLQRHLVQAQAEEHCRSRRRCDYCGAQRPLGLPAPAPDVFVWRRGRSCPAFRTLPLRRGVAPDHDPGRGDHARPLHAGL